MEDPDMCGRVDLKPGSSRGEGTIWDPIWPGVVQLQSLHRLKCKQDNSLSSLTCA